MFLRRVPVASTRPTLCFPARTLRTLTRSATFDLAFLALNRPFRRERQSTEQRGNCRIRHDGPGRAAANNYAVSDARELGIQAAGRAMLPDTILPRREEFVAVPMLNLEICVDVVFSALTGDCGREHHKRPVRRQSIDKFGGMGSRQMLGDLEALHHVKAPPEVDGPTKVRGAKLICIDHQMFSVDVRAVDTHHSCAGLPPYVQPSAVAASEIDNAADLQRGAQQRNDLLRRTDRKGRQETVEIFGVFVQMFLPDIRQIPGDFAPRIASSTGLGNDKSPSQPRSIWRMSAKTAERWSLGSLREKLVKIGAKVVSHGRYVTFKWPRSRYRRRCLSISCRSSPNYGDRPSQHEEAQAQNAPRQGDGYASMQAKWRGSAIRCRPRPPHIVSCLRRQPFTVTEAG